MYLVSRKPEVSSGIQTTNAAPSGQLNHRCLRETVRKKCGHALALTLRVALQSRTAATKALLSPPCPKPLQPLSLDIFLSYHLDHSQPAELRHQQELTGWHFQGSEILCEPPPCCGSSYLVEETEFQWKPGELLLSNRKAKEEMM